MRIGEYFERYLDSKYEARVLVSLAVGIFFILILGVVIGILADWFYNHPVLIFLFGSSFILIECLVIGNCWARFADAESSITKLELEQDKAIEQERFYAEHKYPGG